MSSAAEGKAAANAKNLQLRATEIQNRANKAEVASILQKHPCAAADTVQYLHNKGYYAEGPSMELPKSKWAVGLENREKKKKAARAEAAREAALQADRIPTKYWMLGALSAKLLESKVLQKIDPMVFSNPNLVALKKSWEKEAAHSEMLMLIEFLTGMGASMKLTEKLRDWATFTELMQKLHAPRCWRLSSRSLPINYDLHGIFQVEALSDSAFRLSMRTGPHTVVMQKFSWPLLQQRPSGPCKLRVDENWSESYAHIQDVQQSLEGLVCMDLLKNALQQRQSSLEDGGPRSIEGPLVSEEACDGAEQPQMLALPSWAQSPPNLRKRRAGSDAGSSVARGSSCSSLASPPSSRQKTRLSDGHEDGQRMPKTEIEDDEKLYNKDGQPVDKLVVDECAQAPQSPA